MQTLDDRLAREVKLQPGREGYQVIGFSKAYETYSEVCADKRFGAGLLIVIGLAISALGIGIWIFGPSTIYYNRYSGMTFVQHMQAAPHLVIMIGTFCLALAGRVRGGDQLNRELFLLAHCKIVDNDGNDVREQVDILHVEGDGFSISLKEVMRAGIE
ncbi:hypothetical protein ACIQUF_22880 [Pseudomonas sp. NPDC090233]|uniref:hypothetical protein n=1 Tax=Pseudomonas sp. NPDC090233 TaxID=3364479 RepID=UPI00383A71C8